MCSTCTRLGLSTLVSPVPSLEFICASISRHAGVIDKTSMSDPGVNGLVLLGSQHALVARTKVSGSTGYAMVLFGVDDSRIQHNRLNADQHGSGT